MPPAAELRLVVPQERLKWGATSTARAAAVASTRSAAWVRGGPQVAVHRHAFTVAGGGDVALGVGLHEVIAGEEPRQDARAG